MPTIPDDPRSPLVSVPNVTELLEALGEVGFGTSLRPGNPPGSLVCAACGSVSETSEFSDFWASRLEGTSDPDDMVLVIAARCPVCEAGGAAVLGFGPESSPEDADIVAHVPDHAMRAARPRT